MFKKTFTIDNKEFSLIDRMPDDMTEIGLNDLLEDIRFRLKQPTLPATDKAMIYQLIRVLAENQEHLQDKVNHALICLKD